MVSPLEGSLARTIGRALSSVFLDATLTRYVQGGAADPADPPEPTEIEYTCKAIEDTYSAGQRANGLVTAQDVKVLILASTLSVEPQSGDRIAITRAGIVGPSRTIVPMGTSGLPGVIGDPARATWECRTRT